MGQEPNVTGPVEKEELDEGAFESNLLANHHEKCHRRKRNYIHDVVRDQECEDIDHGNTARIVAARVGAVELGVRVKLEPGVEEVGEEIEHQPSVAVRTDELSFSNLNH